MLFRKLRNQVKHIVVVVVIAFVGGSLYIGGTSFFGGEQTQVAQTAIATVNGRDISYQQFQQQYVNEVQQREQEDGRLRGTEMESIRYQALESLVGSVLLTQEIENRGIDAPSSEVEDRFEQIKSQFESEEQFQQQLEFMGINENQLREAVKQEVRMDRLRREVAGDIEIPEEEVRKAYEQVDVRHILIRPDGADDEAEAAARQRAEEIYAEVTVDNFAEMAAEYSEDTGSAEEGGELGTISRGETVEEFEEKAFSMDVGTISEPVKSNFGYHIIYVTDRRDAEGEEFEEQRSMIEDRIFQEKSQDVILDWFSDLREEADVNIRDDELKAHHLRRQDKFEEAEEYYLSALEAQPENGYLYASLAKMYTEMDRLEEAGAKYEKAVEYISNDGLLFMQKGDLHRQLDEDDKAIEAYLKASSLEPNDLFFQLQVYNHVAELGRWEEAEEIEQRITEIQERGVDPAGQMMPQQDLEAVEDLEDLEAVEDDLVDEDAAEELDVDDVPGLELEAEPEADESPELDTDLELDTEEEDPEGGLDADDEDEGSN